MKILAVDDELFILELMPLLAAKVGFPDVTTFSSGRMALEALRSGDRVFDCLVLDINMPEMDGIELCAHARMIPAYRFTPIIMLTAMSGREFMDNAFKAGATDYATKPFDIHELGARLRVAQELVTARRTIEKEQASRPTPEVAPAKSHGFAFSEAVTFDGVKDVVDFGALKNYLRQSSRAGLAVSQVLAVKIDRIEDLYDRANSDEYTFALREVADTLGAVMRPAGALIGYSGQGVFVVVSNNPSSLIASEIELDVQQLLDEKTFDYGNGSPMDIEVSIGSPVQPSFGDIADVPRSVERAIARAERRAEAKRSNPRALNIRRLGI